MCIKDLNLVKELSDDYFWSLLTISEVASGAIAIVGLSPKSNNHNKTS